MKIEIEPQDIEAIAQRVFVLIRPLMVSRRNEDAEGELSNVKEISKYLGVKPSWVYGKVHNKTFPHIDVDGWLKLNQTRTRY